MKRKWKIAMFTLIFILLSTTLVTGFLLMPGELIEEHDKVLEDEKYRREEQGRLEEQSRENKKEEARDKMEELEEEIEKKEDAINTCKKSAGSNVEKGKECKKLEKERDSLKSTLNKLRIDSPRPRVDDHLLSFPTKKTRDRFEKLYKYKMKYSEFPPSRYSLEMVYDKTSIFDVEKNVQNLGFYILAGVSNMVWAALYMTSFFMINVIIHAFQLDIVTDLAKELTSGIGNLAGWVPGTGFLPNSLWGKLLPIVVSLAGAWLAVKAIQRKSTQVWTGFLSVIAITIFSVGFFYSSKFIVTNINGASKELSNSILSTSLGVSHIDVKNEVAPYAIGDELYKALIFEPYLLLQYGASSELLDDSVEKSLLEDAVGSKSRELGVIKLAEEYSMMKPNGAFERLKLLAILVVNQAIMFIVLFAIAGSVIFYQAYFIILALLFPIVGIFSIFPTYRGILKRWLLLFFRTGLMKFFLTFFLSVVLTIITMVRNATSDEGPLMVLVIQTILLIGVLIKRSEILSIINLQADSLSGSSSSGGLGGMLSGIGAARMITKAPSMAMSTGRVAWKTGKVANAASNYIPGVKTLKNHSKRIGNNVRDKYRNLKRNIKNDTKQGYKSTKERIKNIPQAHQTKSLQRYQSIVNRQQNNPDTKAKSKTKSIPPVTHNNQRSTSTSTKKQQLKRPQKSTNPSRNRVQGRVTKKSRGKKK